MAGGLTPRFQIPYAVGTDKVVAGDNDMGAGALKVDGLLPSLARAGSVLANSGQPSTGFRIFTQRASVTTLSSGKFAVPVTGFAAITFATIIAVDGIVVFSLFTTPTIVTEVDFIAYRVDTGGIYPNGTVNYTALVVGLSL